MDATTSSSSIPCVSRRRRRSSSSRIGEHDERTLADNDRAPRDPRARDGLEQLDLVLSRRHLAPEDRRDVELLPVEDDERVRLGADREITERLLLLLLRRLL